MATSATGRRFRELWPAALLVLAGAAAYANSFAGPFLYDDQPSIVDNRSIRHLATAFWPDHGVGQTVEGRPVLNLTLAVNYALGGTRVWGYHLVNLLIHLAAGLTLFGLLRRTFLRWSALRAGRSLGEGPSPTRLSADGVAQRVGDNALHLSFLIALLWTLHPLQTESVTYVIQRAESLMGLFFLFTFYAFVRAAEGVRAGLWRGLCVASFLLGTGTKEIIVAALPLLLLYDAVFVSGSLKAAWRAHRGTFVALAACLLILASLIASTGGNRSGTIGLGVGQSPFAYALTQPQALCTYLRLCLVPFPQVFEYGPFWAHPDGTFFLEAAGIGGLLVLTAVAMRRAPALGFLGAWFFLILAPTSLAPAVIQMIVEHRMYLPLAAVLTLAGLGLHRVGGRASFPLMLAWAAALGGLTFHRNAMYRSEVRFWRDSIAKRPNNERAHYNLGCALNVAGRPAEAIPEFEAALRLKPDDAEVRYNLGCALDTQGRTAEAIVHYQEAIALKPDHANAHYNLGNALRHSGRTAEAIVQYREVLRLRPDDADAHNNLANSLRREGRTAEAITEYQAALRLQPDDAVAHFNLADALLATPGQTGEAAAQLRIVLRLQPDNALARQLLAETGIPAP